MTLFVRIKYVDGMTIEVSPTAWPSVRADGVDEVEYHNKSGSTRFSGRSAYWLYPEDDIWVAGAASFGYDPIHLPEVLLLPDETMDTRTFEYVPDLKHYNVKLGWWWPGTTDRPVT